MPSWGEVLAELQLSAQGRGGNPDVDGVRRKYLSQMHALTGRDTILYATRWLDGSFPGTSITLEDMQGMMEVCRNLTGPSLDLILHSPGGSAEATNSIVRYLRHKFTDIRVFVPLAAMSAATMWALAGNSIVMGKHSQLGPIDPQLSTGQWQHPARALINQFEIIKQECSQDPSVLGAWLPILQQYGPAVLYECGVAEKLARRLVQEWLAAYMFANLPDAERDKQAERVATYFADYEEHQSHGLGIDRDQAKTQGVVIVDLEQDQALQDAVLSVYHAAIHTMTMGGALKIVENQLGRAFVKSGMATITIPMQQMPGQVSFPPGIIPGPTPTTP